MDKAVSVDVPQIPQIAAHFDESWVPKKLFRGVALGSPKICVFFLKKKSPTGEWPSVLFINIPLPKKIVLLSRRSERRRQRRGGGERPEPPLAIATMTY